jgi:hypothetical protein
LPVKSFQLSQKTEFITTTTNNKSAK